MTLITDLQYFANIYWYKKVYNYKDVVISPYEQHIKMSFRNRTWLGGGDGKLSLSVPIAASRNERQLYKDLRIVPGRWQTIHFRAIVSCYNRSAWFEYYRDELAVLYERSYTWLWDWNLACLEWSGGCLKREVPVRVVEDPATYRLLLEKLQGGTEDFRNRWLPADLEKGGVAETNSIQYRQVFEDRNGFLPGLSVLDLLFCEGPAALAKLGAA